jgi:hypothetical protein
MPGSERAAGGEWALRVPSQAEQACARGSRTYPSRGAGHQFCGSPTSQEFVTRFYVARIVAGPDLRCTDCFTTNTPRDNGLRDS